MKRDRDPACYVYIISQIREGELVSPVKVGISSSPFSRLLGLQTGCPFKIELVATFATPRRDIALSLEQAFHDVYVESRLEGEWLEIEPFKAIASMCANFRAMVTRMELEEDEADTVLHMAGVYAAEDKIGLGAKQ
jgi:hypothetical protein